MTDFRLTEEDAHHVAEICKEYKEKNEGRKAIPKGMTLKQLVDRLDAATEFVRIWNESGSTPDQEGPL